MNYSILFLFFFGGHFSVEPLRFLLPVREGQLGKEIIAAVQEKMRCTAKDMRDHGLGRLKKKP